MAINPADITTVRVDQLASEPITLTSLLPHQVGTDLKQDTVQALVDLVATAIGTGSGVGYLPISVTDGQQLPAVPADPSFFLCGAGTYLNINGFPNVICTGELNAVMSLSDHWELAVEIPIVAEIGVQTVTGSAVDNTDPLNPVINSTSGSIPTLQQVVDTAPEIVDNKISFANTGNDFETNINRTGDGGIDLKSETNDTSTQIGAGVIYVGTIDGSDSVIITKDNVLIDSTNTYAWPSTPSSTLAVNPILKTTAFTAENGVSYLANGTFTITDFTPTGAGFYSVFVVSGIVTIGGVDYGGRKLYYRVYNGTNWNTITINPNMDWGSIGGSLSAQTDLQTALDAKLPLAGGSLTGALNEAQGANIASATTTNIGAATGNSLTVTGTTTITGFGTIQAGTRRIVTFSGILILTHNGTSLILPTSANITTAVGDTATFVSLGSGNWKCVNYMRADGSPLVGGGGGAADEDYLLVYSFKATYNY